MKLAGQELRPNLAEHCEYGAAWAGEACHRLGNRAFAESLRDGCAWRASLARESRPGHHFQPIEIMSAPLPGPDIDPTLVERGVVYRAG